MQEDGNVRGGERALSAELRGTDDGAMADDVFAEGAHPGPLDPDLTPQEIAWVRELRQVWKNTGMSMNGFAAGNPLDKGTISRYLSGKRVPGSSWFVNRLLDIQAENGNEVPQQTRDRLSRLRLAASHASLKRLPADDPGTVLKTIVRITTARVVTRLAPSTQPWRKHSAHGCITPRPWSC